jgi:protein O-mannosyl-transferase
LSTFFWMLTLCLYVRYTEQPGIGRYLASLLAFILALISKPMVVTLPIILILLDYWPLKRFESHKDNPVLWQIKEKMPFFILSAAVSFVTLYGPQNPLAGYYSITSRMANASVVFVSYLEMTFWPRGLAVFYPFPIEIPLWQIAGALSLAILITIFVIVKAKRYPYLFTGWMWYVITIMPVIGIIQIGIYSMADRYHYLPSIGIAIMLAWGVPSLIKSEEIVKKLLIPAGLVFIVCMAILTYKQCSYWKNSSILFKHVLQVTENNYLAHNSIGLVMFGENKMEEAVNHYNEAIRIKPDFARAYHNRGVVWAGMGYYQKAIEDYNAAIRMMPDVAEIYNNRGIAYSLQGKQRRAIEDYDEAIRFKPEYFEAYNNRGLAYSELGYKERAIEEFNQAIRLKPDQGMFYINRAAVHFYQKKNEEGCFDAKKSCDLGNCVILKDAEQKGYCR